ncbi:AimR family lysis-lysogeny pheromone receptor [Priestia aryabhattai]|uniref:AimR family lysis-lysogeny pheromone receptor n=1 Tax=Priestia aryabhattai TaxID=412384 RepID=UPI003C8F8452
MNKLMQKIREDAKTMGINNKTIAEHIQAQSASITYYFDGTNHMNFNKFIRMVHLIYKTDYDNIIFEYCAYCDDFPKMKPQAVREALDWSLGRWNSELTQYLLDLEKQYSPKTHEIYNLLFLSRERKITPTEFFERVHHLPYGMKGVPKKDVPLVKVLIDICRMYYYDYIKQYKGIKELAKLTFKEIKKVSSDLLRYSYTLCVQEMLSVYYLKYNKVGLCNEMVKEMVTEETKSLFPLTYFWGLSTIAELNVFTNYQTSLHHIEKVLHEMQRLGFTKYERKYEYFKSVHDFIKIINQDHEGLYLTNEDQRLHKLSMVGDEESKKEAFQIIESILSSEDELDEFQTCYQAIL